MNKFYALVVMAATLLFSWRAGAQEALVMLSENPAAQPQPKTPQPPRSALSPAAAMRAAPLSPGALDIPFVDDFAGVHPWPNPALWETGGVYVNSHYALNMPTTGVATFDALNGHGRLYPHLDSLPKADTLASLPIKLAGKNNVVLSFFYQPGGLGDMPGLLDKLHLELHAPDTNWTEVWSAAVNIDSSSVLEYHRKGASYDTDTTITRRFDTLHTQFVYVALAIDPLWCKDGFQFRFTNDVSLTVNKDVPGRANNADFWHLDFVYLDSGRHVDSTRLEDVGIARPQTHITTSYTSVPAHHLEYAAATLFPGLTTFNIAYRNLGMHPQNSQNVYRQFFIKPVPPLIAPSKEYLGGSENIFNGELQERTFEFEPYDFASAVDPNATDVAFEISSCLVFDMGTTALRKALRHNDTTRYIQTFQDYYACDDGSAENGYGLFGYGTSNGRVAVQFKSARADSLRGVYLYFNMAKDSANLKSFDLAVWNDNGGVPGNLLRREKFSRPEVDSLNAYVAYKFSKPVAIARNQTFYVGWIQTSEVFLNIGFDANTPNRGKNLYALGDGNWYESVYDGALMMRPVFTRTPGNFPNNPVLPAPPTSPAATSGEYIVYPNPAKDWITIRNVKAEALGVAPPRPLVEIFDVSGRKHRTGYTDGSGMFSVSGLPAGIYVIRIIESETVKTSQKIIVN
jgi:hypothetical protein